MHKLNELNYKGKKVLLRVDLNVPVMEGKILDDTRINKIIPTIKKGGKPAIFSFTAD